MSPELPRTPIRFDADATGYKVILGWRPLDWLAVEGNYVDLGSGDDDVLGERVESEIDGLTLSAVGFLPVGPVDLFARAGIIDWTPRSRCPTSTSARRTMGPTWRTASESSSASGSQHPRRVRAIRDQRCRQGRLPVVGLTYTFL
jgi:hypothetical protein